MEKVHNRLSNQEMLRYGVAGTLTFTVCFFMFSAFRGDVLGNLSVFLEGSIANYGKVCNCFYYTVSLYVCLWLFRGELCRLHFTHYLWCHLLVPVSFADSAVTFH